MKLNTTTQYAIRFLHELIEEEDLTNIKALSEKLDIPYKYTSAIVTSLVKAGLIESIRGRNGGIKLGQNAQQIMLSDIMAALNEPYTNNECLLGVGVCNHEEKCALHQSWMEPRESLAQMFQNTSLHDLSYH